MNNSILVLFFAIKVMIVPLLVERRVQTVEMAKILSLVLECWSPLNHKKLNINMTRKENGWRRMCVGEWGKKEIWYLQSNGPVLAKCALNLSFRSLLTPISWNILCSLEVYSNPQACWNGTRKGILKTLHASRVNSGAGGGQQKLFPWSSTMVWFF